VKPIVVIYNYQTLIAGFAAFAGAVLTVLVINKQIREASRQESERRRRQNLAARAMMPAALSEICFYSERCISLLRTLLPATGEHRVFGHFNEVPAVPAEALFTLRQSIEFGDDRVAEAIADLIRKIQIQHTRIIGTKSRLLSPDETVLRTNLLDYIVDALEVHARASNLFRYARRETEHAPAEPNSDNVKLSARNCGLWDDINSEIFGRIEKMYGTENGAGIAVPRR
jgi:hypothetical protein